MKATCALLLAAIGLMLVGCGTTEPTSSDQVKKVEALQKNSKDSMAKDGIKSE